jgi:hypothetical protein
MATKKLVFRVHALGRMFERGISIDDVRHVLAAGESIEDYPADLPYPTRLVLGWSRSRPLHVVAADNSPEEETIVVTVYEPAPNLWTPDFKRRKP